MSFKILTLVGHLVLTLPSGESVDVRRVSESPFDERSRDLVLVMPTGLEIMLPRVIDTDDRLDQPRVFMFSDTTNSSIMLFGGEMAYRLGSQEGVVTPVPTFRRYEESGLWTTDVIAHGQVLIVLYDTAILVLDENLNIKWHGRKNWTDRFVYVDDNVLQLAESGLDRERLVTLGLHDGHVVSAPANWHPDEPLGREWDVILEAIRRGTPLSKEEKALLDALMTAYHTDVPYAESPEVKARFDAVMSTRGRGLGQ